MTASTSTTTDRPFRGVRRHGRGFQVRVRPFDPETHYQEADAIARVLELERLRADGVRHAPRASRTVTLAHLCDAHYQRVESRGGRRGPLTEGGLKHIEKALRPWRDGTACDERGRPLGEMALCDVTVAAVEGYFDERAAVAPTAARSERQELLKVLKLAARRDIAFNIGLLSLEPIAVSRRRGIALSIDELDFLASCAPEYIFNLYRFGGRVGMRIGAMLTLTDDRVDLRNGFVFVPAELDKEKRDKEIPLLPNETRMLAEQLAVRAQHASLVFPRKMGGPWKHGPFYTAVWAPTRARAQRMWRLEHDLAPGAVTPFDGLRPHDLRHTAASLMRDAGLEPELVAERLGHKDAGHLMMTVYRHVRRDRLVSRLGSLGDGLTDALNDQVAKVAHR